jgi:hypothetical protein
MSKLLTVLLLTLCLAPFLSGQETRFGKALPKRPNPADFPIKVHVSASHVRHSCEGGFTKVSCNYGLYVDAVLNGKKLELLGTTDTEKYHFFLLIPGDYQARITLDLPLTDDAVISREYDVLLPDDTLWHCVLSGISE